MKVSSKSRYALMALVELDLRTRAAGRPVRLIDLAHVRGHPRAVPRAALRRSSPGGPGDRAVAASGGGFTFARRPDQLTVLDVVQTLDGAFATWCCTPGDCDLEERAGAGAVWLAAGDAYEDVARPARPSPTSPSASWQLEPADPSYQI